MSRTRSRRAVLSTALMVLTAFALAESATAGSREKRITIDRADCEHCRARAKIRLQLDEVQVNQISENLPIQKPQFAASVRNMAAAALQQSKHLIVLTSPTNLAPAESAKIDAHFELQLSVDTLSYTEDVQTKQTERYWALRQQATDKKVEGSDLLGRSGTTEAGAGIADGLGDAAEQFDSSLGGAGALGGAISGIFKANAAKKKARGEKLLLEAENLEREAAEEPITETTFGDIDLRGTWQLVNLETGETVESGSLDDSKSDEVVATYTESGSQRKTESLDVHELLSDLVTDIVTELRSQVQDETEDTPFRTRVQRVKGKKVYLDAGSDVGVAIGDTFSVRRPELLGKSQATGREMFKDGPQVATVRVVSVAGDLSEAEFVTKQKRQRPKAGDSVEWIGLTLKPSEMKSRVEASKADGRLRWDKSVAWAASAGLLKYPQPEVTKLLYGRNTESLVGPNENAMIFKLQDLPNGGEDEHVRTASYEADSFEEDSVPFDEEEAEPEIGVFGVEAFTESGQILVVWDAAGEERLIGFYVTRRRDPREGYERVTSLIPASRLGSYEQAVSSGSRGTDYRVEAVTADLEVLASQPASPDAGEGGN